MEAGNFRSLGVENSRGRVASKICKLKSILSLNLIAPIRSNNISKLGHGT
jgi:hypothetical protein